MPLVVTEIEAVVAPVFHKYEVPSDAVNILVSPKQKLVPLDEVIEAINASGSVITTEAEVSQPLASVIVNWYGPAGKFVVEGEIV